ICREVSANARGILADVWPAIPHLLAEIQRCKKLLAIVSGNLEIVGWHKLVAAGLREFFSVGSFGDQCELRTTIFANAVARATETLGTTAACASLRYAARISRSGHSTHEIGVARG